MKSSSQVHTPVALSAEEEPSVSSAEGSEWAPNPFGYGGGGKEKKLCLCGSRILVINYTCSHSAERNISSIDWIRWEPQTSGIKHLLS
jgi:hypothetical protein